MTPPSSESEKAQPDALHAHRAVSVAALLYPIVSASGYSWGEVGTHSCVTAALRCGLLHQASIRFLAFDRCHPAVFQVIKATVEHLSIVRQSVEVANHRVFDQIFARASALDAI